MNKIILMAAAAAGALALPALALAQHDGGWMPRGPETRAEVQKKLSDKFAEIDANKDGAITKAEFDAHREAMKKEWAERRQQRMDAHFAAMDTNKDGQISKAEFDAFHAQRGEQMADRGMRGPEGGERPDGPGPEGMAPSGDHMKHMHGRHGHGHGPMHGGDWFAMMDANKDGKVTLAEFEAKPLAMFDKADANKDGTVTPEERKAAWMKMRAEWKAKKAPTPAPASKQ